MLPGLRSNPFSHFRLAVAVCLVLLVGAIIFILTYGKHDSFILINGYYNSSLDRFFQYMTYLGDGLIYIPLVAYCLIFNRAYLVPVLTGIVVCTLLTQGMKHFIYPDALRPYILHEQKVLIHQVEGVPLHRQHSFPSGHTSTAFTSALLLAEILRRKIWSYVLPVIALLVGYSRVYLAQHFVTDVSAGMAVGIISAYVGLLVYKQYLEKPWFGKRSDIHAERI